MQHVLDPNDFRSALQTVGLTQSGLARTLVAWGDPRGFNVVLRWVQRAASGSERSPYVGMVLRILKGHVEHRKLHYRTLDLLESGRTKIGANHGTGWQDTTLEEVNEIKGYIRELDQLLAECRLDPPVNSPRVAA